MVSDHYLQNAVGHKCCSMYIHVTAAKLKDSTKLRDNRTSETAAYNIPSKRDIGLRDKL